MRTPFIVLIAIFLAAGVITNVRSLTKGARESESWLENQIPTQVGPFILQPSEPGAKTTYKMDKSTYDELDPIGITAQRLLASDGKEYEAVIVAGDSMQSFHDQRWCFHAQGWEIMDEGYTSIKTKSYGEIPVTLVKISREGANPTFAVFTFRGPTAFHPTIGALSKDYFFFELLHQKKFMGAEYRFIPGFRDATKEELLQFAADYIDKAHETSKGVL